MRSMTFQIDDRSTGTVIPAVTITVIENDDGTLTFTLTQSGPLIGDLRGIFFDVADESLIPSLTVSASSAGLTEVRTGNDSVVDLGQGANMEGLAGSDGGYDVGLEIGTSGVGADDHRTFSFTLSAASALTLEDFANIDFGVRLTSVGEDGGERTASAKLLETVSGALDAIDDAAALQEDGLSPVATGNVLINDLGGGTSQSVVAVAGGASNVGAEVAGEFGVVRIQADGTFVYTLDHAAAQSLAHNETHVEAFSYTARSHDDATSYSEDTATLFVTLTGVNDAPVVAGGQTTGEVFEDGSRRAQGQLTASDVDHGAVLSWSVVNPAVLATPDYRFLMDSFRIVRNGFQYYNDDFGDNVPPPSAPGFLNEEFPTSTSYFLPAGTSLQEAGNRLILDGSRSATTPPVGSPEPFHAQSATLNTDTSADLSRGLKIDDSFAVEGRFDLVMPDELQAYGVRLIDINASDVVDVRVRREGGIVYVVLREADVPANTVTTLARIALQPLAGENQIVLRLTHDPLEPGAIHASFDLLGGPVVRSFDFGSTVGRVFGTGTPGNPGDDEVFVRAQIVAVAPSDLQNGVYGTLHIDDNGKWNYVLDNGGANVQALALGEHATDTFTVRVTDEHGASATQTVTIDIAGSNDAPVITGPFTSGFVVEDFGPSVASGQLGAFDPDHNAAPLEWTVTRGVIQGPGVVSSGQADYLVRVDELQIVRNGALLFKDSFDAGGPPPSGPNFSLPPFPPASYLTAGIFSEQDGKLVMDGSVASVFNGVANNDLQAGHSATLITDNNPADLTRGLKSDDSFEITARFDLTPPGDGHVYGITLNDQSNGGVPPDQLGESTLALVVRRDAGGQLRVEFNGLNVVADTVSVASRPLDALVGEDQIVLRLTHDKDNVGVVHASYDLVSSAGGASRSFAFSEVRHIFGTATPDYAGDDENWVRVGITTRAPDTQGDPNAGGDTYTGMYGSMHVTQSGAWNYTLDNSLASTQSLAQNQFATDQFTVRAVDQYGAPAFRFVPITVSGSNDAPIATGGIAAGLVQEDGAADAAGVVSFTDVDVIDFHTASFAASPFNTTALGTFTLGGLSELPNAADGSVSWSYALNNGHAQYLAEGQSVTETYTVNVQDDWGAVGTQDVLLTITGDNDAPTFTSTSGGGGASGIANGSFEDGLAGWQTSGFVFLNFGNATDGNYSAHLQAGAVWYSDLEAFLGVAPGTISGLQPETGATTGSAMSRQITLDAGQTLTFDWQFIANDNFPFNDFSFFTVAPLSASELADVAMVGDFGNSGWQAGQYTAPVSGTYNIGFGVVNVFDNGFSSILNIDRVATVGASGGGEPGAHITEDGLTSAAGMLGFSDVDLADRHSAFATAAGTGYLGTLSAAMTADSTGTGGGIVTWSFSADNAELQQLSAGEVRTQTYAVSVDDGHGGVASRDVTITLHGVNDAPVALFVPASANEDGPATLVTADYIDPDAGDTHTFAVGTAGTLGSVVDNGDGTFTYSANGQFEYLGEGHSALDFFSYWVFDDHGGSSPGNVTVAIVGQNDAPTATADPFVADLTEDDAVFVNVLGNDFDIDTGDTLSVTAVGASQYGASITINGDGTLRYDARASAALQDLNDGDVRLDTFSYTITDGHGATSTATASVQVRGVSDANNTPPVAVDDTNAGDPVYDQGFIPPNFFFFFDPFASGNVLANDTDADPGAVLSVVAVNGDPNGVGTLLQGTFGTLQLNSDGFWTYNLHDFDADTNALAVGETGYDSFTYLASDQHGATASATLKVAITGSNDVPTASAAIGAVTEDTSPVATGQLTGFDPDHGATLHWSQNFAPTFSADYQFRIDNFSLTRNGSVIFNDGFSDGIAPPQTPLAGNTLPPPPYSTLGTFTEADGRAVLNGSGAQPYFNFGSFGTGFTSRAVFLTNADSNNLVNGLKDVHDFRVEGVFDLTVPERLEQRYGIGVDDRNFGVGGDDFIQLVVQRDASGAARLSLLEADATTNSTTVIDTLVLDTDADDAQIVLRLDHQAALRGQVFGSYVVLDDAGQQTHAGSFAHTGQIFGTETPDSAADDERWTRGLFFAAASPTEATVNGIYGKLMVDVLTGEWRYTLNSGAANVQALAQGMSVQDSFEASVVDEYNFSSSAPVTITVNGSNDAPVANPNAVSTTENQAVLVDVLANDTDVDTGAVLTLVSASAPTGQGSASIANGQVRFNPGSDFDHLEAGEQATVTLSYTMRDEHGAQSSSTIDVTVLGEADVAADGVVYEDGPRRASGALDTTGLDASQPLVATVTGNGAGAPMANYRFLIDELNIFRGTADELVFTDTFGNNQAPPAGANFAGVPTTYGLNGTFLEANNRAVMDGLNSAGAAGVLGNFATLLTDISANTAAGLKQAQKFSVEGRFDLVLPEEGQTYGIRLTDNLNGIGNDIVEVAVRRVGGQVVAILRELEATSPTSVTATTLETRPLNLADGENQITLRLGHAAGSDVFTASFDIWNGVVTRSETFTQVGHAFSGETWTRAQIVASSPSVPQNGVYGNLSVDADGVWTYQTRNNSGALQALGQDDPASDIFTVQLTDAHGTTTTQTVTVGAIGTDDAPIFLANSQGQGFVVEDNVDKVKGTLFVNDVDGTEQHWTVGHAPLIGVGTTSAYDSRFHFLLDQFRVERNGDTEYFVDDFADGTPAAPPTYLPNGLLGEFDGRMVMDGSGSAAVRGVGTDVLRVGVSALLATSIDAADPTRGLKRADSFTVEARYDLPVADESFFLPTKPKPGQFYGIALTDQTGGGIAPDQLGDDLLTVGLTNDGAGNLIITFTDANSVNDVSEQLGSIALPTLQAGETQVVFRLSHAAGSGTVRAEFDLVGPGIEPEDVRSFAFVTEGHLFGSDTPDYAGDDENWTRAQVISFGNDTGGQTFAGTYGTLTVDDFGVWTYDLDNDAANVQNLPQGQAVVDTFSVRVTDEYGVSSFRPVSVTVIGTGETPAPGPLSFTGTSNFNELVSGTEFDDQFTGGLGNDFLIGLAGSDRFIYQNAGQGVDTIVDFTPGAGGDKIDIRDVLAGSYMPGTSNIADFVQIAHVGSHDVLRVDANGTAGGPVFTDLATLQGATGLLLNDLIANQNLIVS